MPFDDNLVLHDGTTITADIAPTSTSRTSGSAVIDLRETTIKGLYAILFLDEDLAESGDTMVISIEESSDLSTWVELARFPEITSAATADAIYERSIISKLRYIRAKINVTDSDGGSDFSVANCRVLLSTSRL